MDQANNYKLIISDLNSKIKELQNEKSSLTTVIKTLHNDTDEESKESWKVVNKGKVKQGQLIAKNGTTVIGSEMTKITNRYETLNVSDMSDDGENQPIDNIIPKDNKQAEMAKSKSHIPDDSMFTCNQGTSKSNSGNEIGSQDKSALVIGDSIIKEIEVNKLSRSKKITKICMPCATSDQIKERLLFTLKFTHYDEVIIHAGVEDLPNSQPDQIIAKVTDMAASVDSSTEVSI